MGNYVFIRLRLIFAFIYLPAILCNTPQPLIDPAVLTQSKSLGDCQACKLFVESFMKGLERTARGKYEGGDAAWEEENLKKTYKRSEMRLIDIQERICKEESKHAVQCHNIAAHAEEFIEEWWAQNPNESDDLYTYICIDKLKVCCPKHHYGKECTPCPGINKSICSGNGKCRGDGTRKGNGSCLCHKGYTGEKCNDCEYGYYESYSDDTKILCSPCHKACYGCRDGTPKGCMSCKPGFTFDADEGCLDNNECEAADRCKNDEFCVNNIGSYDCLKCDKACDTCHGDGPDMCRKCATGYSKKGEFCIADREDEVDQSEKLTLTRYMTYIGLLIATGILLPRSTHLGSLVGAMVLSYIVGAEYYCMINGHTGLINLKDYDLTQLLHT